MSDEEIKAAPEGEAEAEAKEAEKPAVERNLGDQPIAKIMAEAGLKPHDLVAVSPELMTHKMVSRACKGRRLTPNVQHKVMKALNAATGKNYTLADLFNYS